MSTVKVVNVQHPSASTAAVTLAADGSMTGSFPAPNRNLLYNGAMQVAQRGTSTASITAGGYYTADRWASNLSGSIGTWTQTVENDAPTGSGLRKSVKVLCTAAQASPASGAIFTFNQGLEGQDLQRIAKGTASAQQVTLSFWVKSNVTGTYIANLADVDNNRRVSLSYTISASATWEKKSITFPADTTGAFDNDNAASLYLQMYLAAGSGFTSGTLATSWQSTVDANTGVGQVNLAAATNNYWQITGVQLEVGPVATAFEFKSFGQELRECQRYYQRFSNNGVAVSGRISAMAFTQSATVARITLFHSERMRVKPTAAEFSAVKITDNLSFDSGNCTLTLAAQSSDSATLFDATTTGAGTGSGYSVFADGATAHLSISAEL